MGRPRTKSYELTDEGSHLMRVVSENVSAMRQSKKLTQAELAERSRVALKTLSNLERSQNTLSLATLALLAKGLEVPASELLVDNVPRETLSGEA